MKYQSNELLSLPLFLGMNKGELESVSENLRLTASVVKKGTVIAEEGKECRDIIIVVEGRVACKTESDDHSYSVTEKINAPILVQPERIFGLTQRYSSTFTTLTACTIMVIAKQNVVKLMEMSSTFRINFLNIVTTQSQKYNRQLWHQWPADIEQRIVRFIKNHCLYPAGEKRIDIQMNTMARELGCSRLEVSQALHSLEEKETLIIHRAHIIVPMLQIV